MSVDCTQIQAYPSALHYLCHSGLDSLVPLYTAPSKDYIAACGCVCVCVCVAGVLTEECSGKSQCYEAADHEQRAGSHGGHTHLEHLPPVHQRTPGLAFYRHGDAESRRVRGELQGGVRGEERREERRRGRRRGGE